MFQRGKPIDAEINLGLKEGDELICTKGFVFNESVSGIGPHKPDRVVVVKEYPRFVLIKAEFYNNRGKEYKECINKAALIAGDVEFRKVFREE